MVVMITLDMVAVQGVGFIDASFEGSIALMNAQNSHYYILSGTSRVIWERLKEPVCVRNLCAELAISYNASLETVEADTIDFLSYLDKNGMVTLSMDELPPEHRTVTEAMI